MEIEGGEGATESARSTTRQEERGREGGEGPTQRSPGDRDHAQHGEHRTPARDRGSDSHADIRAARPVPGSSPADAPATPSPFYPTHRTRRSLDERERLSPMVEEGTGARTTTDSSPLTRHLRSTGDSTCHDSRRKVGEARKVTRRDRRPPSTYVPPTNAVAEPVVPR